MCMKHRENDAKIAMNWHNAENKLRVYIILKFWVHIPCRGHFNGTERSGQWKQSERILAKLSKQNTGLNHMEALTDDVHYVMLVHWSPRLYLLVFFGLNIFNTLMNYLIYNVVCVCVLHMQHTVYCSSGELILQKTVPNRTHNNSCVLHLQWTIKLFLTNVTFRLWKAAPDHRFLEKKFTTFPQRPS